MPTPSDWEICAGAAAYPEAHQSVLWLALRSVPHARSSGGLASRRVEFLASGTSHMVALTDRDEVFSWGCGYFGRLGATARPASGGDSGLTHACRAGHGDRTHRYSPAQVTGLPGLVRTVACGGNHTSANSRSLPLPAPRSHRAVAVFVLQDGSVWGCGYAVHGQLGIGYMGNPDKEAPDDSVERVRRASVPPEAGPILDVSCGEKHTILRAATGGSVAFFAHSVLFPGGETPRFVHISCRR